MAVLVSLGSWFYSADYKPFPVSLNDETYIAIFQKEVELGLRPGTNKMMDWRYEDKRRTPVCLLQLHGFGATRKEISPVGEKIAASLEANLFMTRLTGHGLDGAAMGAAHATDWFQDAEEGFAVCRRAGERVGLLATSTGAPLALYLMKAHAADIAFTVMISPNYRPRDPFSLLLKGPIGGFITRYVWKERSWDPRNPEIEKYWTTRYPTLAVHEMMNMLSWTDRFDESRARVPMIVFYADLDDTVALDLIKSKFAEYGGPKRLVEVKGAGHLLAGAIANPAKTDFVVDEAVRFVRESGAVGAAGAGASE